MREFIRHPSDIPIYYNLDDIIEKGAYTLNNISRGGISFQSKEYIKPSSRIVIIVPLLQYNNSVSGLVVWCQKRNNHYNIGVKFTDKESTFRMRMVEQACYIEHYKNRVFKKEKRKLSGEEAAREWIHKYADRFPRVF